jgi:phenylacetate-CoA ligase
VLYPLAERLQGRAIRSKLRQIRSEMAAPFDARLHRARERLCGVLMRAGAEVPYYRDLFRARRFDPKKASLDPACLQELPFLTKEIIRAEGDRLISDQFPKSSLHVRRTGGSTGPSACIYYSPEALDWTAAVNLLVLEWAGKRRRDKEIHLASRFPERIPLSDRIRERVKCAALNRVNIFTDAFDDGALEVIWRRLRRERAYLLQGHPSTAYALALYIERRGYDTAGVLRVFESTGELLDERKRETIERVLQCRVLNRYGSAEFGVAAYEMQNDPQHQLRVLDCLVWPETRAEEDGRRELVCTALMNPAMPLIRYRTGDLADLVQAEDGFFLTNVCGRVHDVIRIGHSRYPTHYLQDLLDRIGGIDEFQVEERPDAPVTLRLAVKDPSRQGEIERRIKGRWPDGLQIEFAGLDQFQRAGLQGKFRYVVRQGSS